MAMKRFFTLIILMTLLAMSTTIVFGADAKVITYYFHSNVRCPTCHKMEQYIKEAIEDNFKDELVDGSLAIKIVNVDEKENKHFVKDYQLYTKTLIILKVKNGEEIEYKNLMKIWEYIRDKEIFFNYVITEINNYLKDSR